MPLEAEQPGLPSFITTPVRPPVTSDLPADSFTVQPPVQVELTADEPVVARRRGRPPKIQPVSDTPEAE
jgi:hypothetical protein